MTDGLEAPSKLRLWREARGWSQREVADLVGLHETSIGKLERGEQSLAPDTKIRFARALGARVRDLFESEPVLLDEAVG